MLNTPFSPWPCFTQEEIDAVATVLRSNKVNYWTGTEGREFEHEFAAFAGADYAIALANGTVALDLALKALGVGPGDEVIVTARTFLASATCIVNAGATPVFADVDRDSQNITVDSISTCLTPRTRAVICVHLAGMPCEMDPIMALARDRDFYVIEDCAQTHGATYHGKPVGSIGHIGAWSFCQDKIMTTGGEGGMVTTNDRNLWLRMWSYKDHGKNWSSVYEKDHPPGFRWLHDSAGTNWRMTEMQAAIGRIQLLRMPEWSATRRRYAEAIWGLADTLPGLRVPKIPEHVEHGAYKCYVFVNSEELSNGVTRDTLMQKISAQGVPCYSGSCSEVYLERVFQELGLAPAARLPVARELGESSLMFLVHPTLTDREISKTCAVLGQVMADATNRQDGISII
jgi:dTDP-4-amino-4,6-dideoxygalactose transaminase